MRKIGILGAGESGVGAALLAVKKGEKPFVSDFGSITGHYRSILEKSSVDFEEGGHSLDTLSQCDVIVKSPGIPDNVPVVKNLKEKGKIVISELEYAYQHRYSGTIIIGITGSNGKTTTTNLVHHLLHTGGLNAVKGGNLGTCFSSLLLEDQADIYVLEVSSFQLDGIVTFRSDIALLLNITPDHLDRYNYDFDLYAASKMRIFAHHGDADLALFNQNDPAVASRVSKDMNARGITSDTFKSMGYQISNPALRGIHNAYNASFAIVVAEYLRVSKKNIQIGLDSFINDDHRMQTIAVIDGVEWINDSKATNVDSAYYALAAMTKPVIWLAGGIDKGNDYSALLPVVRKNVKALIALGQDNTKLLDVFCNEIQEIHSFDNLRTAISCAHQIAAEGDVVLLSPACASFDLFKNYKDRGNQFISMIWDMIR